MATQRKAKLINVEEYCTTAVCESCGVTAERAYLPKGWSQLGRSRLRIFHKSQWGDALADWCPNCTEVSRSFNNPSAAELHKQRQMLKASA